MIQDILIVDDEPDIRDLVSGILGDEGLKTRVAGTGEQALHQIALRQPSLLILDVWLGDPQYDGLKILQLIKRTNPDLPILMISGHGTVETAVSAIKLGAYDFIEKPFKTERLLMVVARALEADTLRKENRQLKGNLPPSKIVGTSSLIQSVRKTIERVADSRSRVLISGAAGVGKKLAASEIHRLSKRASGPFHVLHCITESPLSLELALFGAEATPTTPRKLGLLELAHGGTLFLDEVTNLPLDTQGKLLRFLHENCFLRTGGGQKVTVDVRILAGTKKDIHGALSANIFREDLYYRLNVVTLSLPCLKDRVEDISPLVAYFTDHLAKKAGVGRRTFSDAALMLMNTYEWPGNILELRNVVERALVFSFVNQEIPVTPDELPSEIRGEKNFLVPSDNLPDFLSMSLREAREYFEREYLLAQVQKFSGNISRTASFVGMERSALHRKLRQLSVDKYKEREFKDEPAPSHGCEQIKNA